MKQILILLSLILLSISGITQVNNLGNPVIRNFDATEYRAAEQNWSITQDNRGVMYFGNHAGVLEYDGSKWNMLPVDNNSPVRAMNVDDNGRVYVGAVGEFGYLEPNPMGKMKYVSLLPNVDSAYRNFLEIWKIYTYGDLVHFSSRTGFHTYDSELDTVTAYHYTPEYRNSIYPLFTFVVDDNIYIGSYINGLEIFKDGEITKLPNGNHFSRKNIFTIIKYDEENILVCTDLNGVFLYNIRDHSINSDFFNKKTREFLITNYLFNAVKLPGNKLGFSTETGGVIITDMSGNIEHIVNSKTGLQDDTALFLFHNSKKESSPLWIALNNGISYVDIFSPIMQVDEITGLRGLVYEINEFNNTIFIGTSTGLYYMKESDINPPEVVYINDIRPRVFGLDIWKNPITNEENLIVGSVGEVYHIDKNFRVRSITRQLNDVTHDSRTVKTSEYYPGRIYLGLGGGLEYLTYSSRGWRSVDLKDFFKSAVLGILEEENGSLWLSTHLLGYTRVDFTGPDINDVTFTTYTSEHGLPENLMNIKLYSYKGQTFFVTAEGVFNFDKESETFVLDNRFNLFSDGVEAGFFAFAKDQEENLWISRYVDLQDVWIEKATPIKDDSFEIIKQPFKPLPHLWCDAIYLDGNDVAWFGIGNQIFSYNKEVEKDYKEPFNALIRGVNTLGDSLLFAGTNYVTTEKGFRFASFDQPDNLKPVLSYRLNNLEIFFSAPYFESQDRIEYSYMLEGFDNWSRWTTTPQAIYSYIPVGSYNFKVKARNVYGEESIPASFSFIVQPPWYRTIFAYIGYGLIAILIVYGLIVLNTRRLKREKEILEVIVKERTAEVVKQKDELEVQRDKIAKQNESITNSIEYAKRIQTAALPPSDFIDMLIPERFILFMPRDIVSGDFYWIGKMGEKVVAVAADCTGHGVPGGFMSMLGIAYLNQIVSSSNDLNAGQILDQLREQVMKSLRQKDEDSESRDGMDIALCIFNKENNVVEFAGANNPLYIIRNDELLETSGDKMPIGIHRRADRNFVNHSIEVQKDDVLYTFSDGYKDQFGGPEGKKFMSRNFKEILMNIHKKPVDEQRDILEKTIIDWSEGHERIDDIVVMGVRIN